MSEKPILFSGPMVRAILENRKWQTRRVVKVQPVFADEASFNTADRAWVWWRQTGLTSSSWQRQGPPFPCPYGQPGDRLWVRESWCPGSPAMCLGTQPMGILPFEKSWKIPKEKPECAVNKRSVVVKYAATWNDGDHSNGCPPMRPSIHMPRWASRITLEVTEVRVQRLQEISEEDAKAEGAERMTLEGMEDLGNTWTGHKRGFEILWDSINGKRPGFAWKDNPWVWAVSFKRLEKGNDNG